MTFPNDVVAVDLDPTVPCGVGRDFGDLVRDVVIEVDLEVLTIVAGPDNRGTRNLGFVVVQANMIVDLGGNGLGDAGADVVEIDLAIKGRVAPPGNVCIRHLGSTDLIRTLRQLRSDSGIDVVEIDCGVVFLTAVTRVSVVAHPRHV